MARTKIGGTRRVPPEKPKPIVGLDRLNCRNADGRLSSKCERPDCHNVVGAITTRTSAKILL
jgi:hypothetical protein